MCAYGTSYFPALDCLQNECSLKATDQRQRGIDIHSCTIEGVLQRDINRLASCRRAIRVANAIIARDVIDLGMIAVRYCESRPRPGSQPTSSRQLVLQSNPGTEVFASNAVAAAVAAGFLCYSKVCDPLRRVAAVHNCQCSVCGLVCTCTVYDVSVQSVCCTL